MGLHVEVKNLVFSYGSETVLDGVSLSLAQGDFIGIIGPNGSGKSTLLKNMAAVLTPDSGEIIIDGKRWRIGSVAIWPAEWAWWGRGAAPGSISPWKRW